MLWLSTPPWGRWIAATLISVLAIWLELRPQSTVEHPFATVDISRGEEVGPANIESRQVEAGLLGGPPEGSVALRDIAAGDPILSGDLGDPGEVVPAGWWVVRLEVPPGAVPGDRVRAVLIDTGLVIDGVVTSAGSADPLLTASGAAAFPDEHAASVAAAVAEGRITVLLGA